MDTDARSGARASAVREKSFALAVREVRMSRWLLESRKEFVLSKQVLRSGTAIGAMVREAEQAESRADFAHKMAIALKEASETEYWLELLHETDLLESAAYESLREDTVEILKLLTSIVKTTRSTPGPKR